METIGERNNNPLNIRRGKSIWKGELRPGTPPDGGDRGGLSFCQFSSMEWGIRAAFCILRTYARKHKANCIRDIIRRWSLPTENDTERYIKNVCLWTGFGGLQRLTEKDWPCLVQAMARQECGAILSEEIVLRGFRLFKEVKSE